MNYLQCKKRALLNAQKEPLKEFYVGNYHFMPNNNGYYNEYTYKVYRNSEASLNNIYNCIDWNLAKDYPYITISNFQQNYYNVHYSQEKPYLLDEEYMNLPPFIRFWYIGTSCRSSSTLGIDSQMGLTIVLWTNYKLKY